MKKVFKPFWSYDIEKTEAWLTAMAEKGYHIITFNRLTRCFFFRHDTPTRIIYRIGYDKIQGDALPKALLDEGWKKVVRCGNWYITANDRPLDQVKNSPVRERVVKHNRKIMYLFTGIGIYFTAVFLFALMMNIVPVLLDIPVIVVDSPLWAVTYSLFAVMIAVYFLAIYSIVKIMKSNKSLILGNEKHFYTRNTPKKNLSKQREKQLKRSGQIIVKRKFSWIYAPDKLEQWLETMEKQGFNLYRVNGSGTDFYFFIGSPRKVSYCADYQNISDESYYQMHRDAGWKDVFRSFSSLQKWTIWSCTYSEGEERPRLYYLVKYKN
ncbi:DUF2812 domain-containing protein [Bacillaceae bacterium Marseille-Q3522]|nr:DUF2812 domain-containing protein [Bacillaceae bacterium Marseille-Q3522]